MRISTAIMTGLVFTATTSVAWSLGAREPAQDALLVPLDALPTSNSASQTPAQTTASPTTESTNTPGATETAAGPTQVAAPTPSPSQTPASNPTSAPAQAPVEPVVVTKTSDVITYKYGVVQISMTKTDAEITDVSLLQGDASYGRDAAYTALINATIQVQGTSYGNVTGATFTTDAFKKAVENVLSKF